MNDFHDMITELFTLRICSLPLREKYAGADLHVIGKVIEVCIEETLSSQVDHQK